MLKKNTRCYNFCRSPCHLNATLQSRSSITLPMWHTKPWANLHCSGPIITQQISSCKLWLQLVRKKYRIKHDPRKPNLFRKVDSILIYFFTANPSHNWYYFQPVFTVEKSTYVFGLRLNGSCLLWVLPSDILVERHEITGSPESLWPVSFKIGLIASFS